MTEEVKIKFTVNEKEIKKELKQIRAEFKKLQKESTDSIGKTDIAFGSFVGNLASNLAGKGISTLINFGKSAVQAAQDMEVLTTQFTVLTGSAEQAQQILSDLNEFAAKTPFQLPGLANATKQLIQAKVPQEELIETLRRIGDISAVTGKAIDELAIPFARLKDRGTVTLEELQKFDDAGAGLLRTMADLNGVSIGDLRKSISAGKVSFEEFEQAIIKVTSEGGKFANGMIKQSETLSGKISTLEDNWDAFLRAVGSSSTGILKDVVDQLTEITQAMTDMVKGGVDPAKMSVEELSKEIATLKSIKDSGAFYSEEDEARLLLLQSHAVASSDAIANLQGLLGQSAGMSTEPEVGGMSVAPTGDDEDPQVVKAEERNWKLRELQLLKQEQMQEGFDAELELVQEQINALAELETMNDEQKAQFQELAIKRDLIRIKKTNKAKLKMEQEQLKVEKNLQNIRNQNTAKAFQLASVIIGNGSKEQFLIQKGLAFAQIAVDDGRAKAAAMASTAHIPYPGNGIAYAKMFAAITANTALSAGIVAASTFQGLSKFQDGGILNAGGSSLNGDNNVARFNDREMFLNMSQQSSLFNAISSGSLGGGGLTAELIAEQTEVLQNKDFMIELDGITLNKELEDINSRRLE